MLQVQHPTPAETPTELSTVPPIEPPTETRTEPPARTVPEAVLPETALPEAVLPEELPEELPRVDTVPAAIETALPGALPETLPETPSKTSRELPPLANGVDAGVEEGNTEGNAGDDTGDDKEDDTEDDTEEEADEEDEGTSILLSTPFLFGLGVLAALLLAIVTVFLIRVFHPSAPEVQDPAPRVAESYQEPVPETAAADIDTAAQTTEPDETTEPDAIAETDTIAETDENFDSQGSGLSRENYGKGALDTEEPDTEEPGTEVPDAEEPDTEEPDTEEPGTEEPGTEEPSAAEPGTEAPGADKSDPSSDAPSNTPPVSSVSSVSSASPASPPDAQTAQPVGETSSESFQIDPAVAEELKESIDIPERLNLAISSIQLPNKSFPELVSLISSLANVPVLVAWETIPSAAELCSRTVTVSLDETTAGTVLTEAARLFGMNIEILPDVVRLYVAEEGSQTKEFPIADLLADTPAEVTTPTEAEITADEEAPASQNDSSEISVPAYSVLPEKLTSEALEKFLASMLSIPPREEEGEGTPGRALLTPEVSDEVAKVEGSALLLARAARVLDQLRCLRKIDSPDLLPREELIPETLAFEHLSGDMSLNFLTSVTLSEALLFFTENTSTEQTRMTGMVDTAALRQAGISLETRIPLHCDLRPAEQVLTELTSGFGLTWFTPAANVVVVTTKERVQELPVIEIHRAQDRSEGFLENAARLVSEARGVFWYDPVSGCVIVYADAVTQRRIAHL